MLELAHVCRDLREGALIGGFSFLDVDSNVRKGVDGTVVGSSGSYGQLTRLPEGLLSCVGTHAFGMRRSKPGVLKEKPCRGGFLDRNQFRKDTIHDC